ncbi:unnamed protein product [Phaeothamnion confervicola]
MARRTEEGTPTTFRELSGFQARVFNGGLSLSANPEEADLSRISAGRTAHALVKIADSLGSPLTHPGNNWPRVEGQRDLLKAFNGGPEILQAAKVEGEIRAEAKMSDKFAAGRLAKVVISTGMPVSAVDSFRMLEGREKGAIHIIPGSSSVNKMLRKADTKIANVMPWSWVTIVDDSSAGAAEEEDTVEAAAALGRLPKCLYVQPALFMERFLRQRGFENATAAAATKDKPLVIKCTGDGYCMYTSGAGDSGVVFAIQAVDDRLLQRGSSFQDDSNTFPVALYFGKDDVATNHKAFAPWYDYMRMLQKLEYIEIDIVKVYVQVICTMDGKGINAAQREGGGSGTAQRFCVVCNANQATKGLDRAVSMCKDCVKWGRSQRECRHHTILTAGYRAVLGREETRLRGALTERQLAQPQGKPSRMSDAQLSNALRTFAVMVPAARMGKVNAVTQLWERAPSLHSLDGLKPTQLARTAIGRAKLQASLGSAALRCHRTRRRWRRASRMLSRTNISSCWCARTSIVTMSSKESFWTERRSSGTPDVSSTMFFTASCVGWSFASSRLPTTLRRRRRRGLWKTTPRS